MAANNYASARYSELDQINAGDAGKLRNAWTFTTGLLRRHDAESGREIWKTKAGEVNLGESMTMAPIVVKNKALVGNGGGEFSMRGKITALDANTGQVDFLRYRSLPLRAAMKAAAGCEKRFSSVLSGAAPSNASPLVMDVSPTMRNSSTPKLTLWV